MQVAGAGVPQAPGTPAPPQVIPAPQVPHCRRLPHPSPAARQLLFCDAQSGGCTRHRPRGGRHRRRPAAGRDRGRHRRRSSWAPCTFHTAGRSRRPIGIGPHPAFAPVHVWGTQAAVPPHTLGLPPPPQVLGAVQLPHCRTLPHPSPTGPQSAPRSEQVRAMQPPSESRCPPSPVPVASPGTDPGHAAATAGPRIAPAAVERTTTAVTQRTAAYVGLRARLRNALGASAADAGRAASAAGLWGRARAALDEVAAPAPIRTEWAPAPEQVRDDPPSGSVPSISGAAQATGGGDAAATGLGQYA